MKKVFIALFFLVLAAFVGFLLYRYFQHSSSIDAIKDPPPLAEVTPTTSDAGNGLRRYQNDTLHFALLYPDALQAKEYTEQAGAMTVSFQDASTGEGFEIYITPYTGQQIDAARFKLDEPSGVMREPTDVLIDGTQATMFFGHNSIMGDTREVWFIKNGYLYEVATFKELDTWLGTIMQTWKFL